MAATREEPAARSAGYQLEGSLLEVCNCDILCPCWVGEDPDNGTCDSVVAYHFDKGHIRGVDVSGRTLVGLAHIPGNILEGNIRQLIYIDDGASEEQKDAMLDAFTGKLGGPLADLAELTSEVVAVEQVPISHEISDGAGTLKIGENGSKVSAQMEPYRGPDGSTTVLNNSIFSTVPGSPAYVGKAASQKINVPEHGYEWAFEDRNAIQSDWKLDFAGE